MHESAQRLFEAAKVARHSIETAADLARALNQSEQTINNWSYRGNGVSKQGRLLAQKELGISATWIEDGTGPMFSGSNHIQRKSGVPGIDPETALFKHSLPHDKGNVTIWERPEDLEPDDDRVWIDRYDYHFSAGSGLIQWEVRQKKALPFNASFFKAKGVRPKDCKLLVTRGDSMEPYLYDHDIFMVDVSNSHIVDGERYAIYFEGEPLVKQIFKEVGGAIKLHSYNPRYPDKLVPPEKLEFVHIVGRVIYRSG